MTQKVVLLFCIVAATQCAVLQPKAQVPYAVPDLGVTPTPNLDVPSPNPQIPALGMGNPPVPHLGVLESRISPAIGDTAPPDLQGEPYMELSSDSVQGCTKGFDHVTYNAAIKENTTYDVVQINPPIRACHNSSDVTFSIQASPAHPQIFWINNQTGELHITTKLDYEQSPSHRIDVSIEEHNSDGSDSGIAYVFINVIDINDNVPAMTQDVYNYSVKEDVAVGRRLAPTISATDADSGNNSMLNYHIEPADSCPLTVDPVTGAVTLNASLDFEDSQQYNCSVYAEETLTRERHKSSVSRVILNVVDVNDNNPKFTKSEYTFVLSSSLSNGEFVGKVTAYDRDSEALGTVSYSVESPFNDALSVDSSTGDITVKAATKFQKEGTISFVVLAHDGGIPHRNGQTEVHMNMVKGYKRWFFYETAYNFNVRENALAKSEVGRVEVNSTGVTYSMDLQYQGLPFNVTPSGVINLSPSPSLDYETLSSYFFTVAARDGEAVVYVNVTVNVTDVNDNAPIFTEFRYNKAVCRLQKGESVIFTVTATDKDSGKNGQVTYNIPSTLYDHLIGINKTTGDIILRKSAVTIDKDQIELTVEATDSGIPPIKRSVQLTITFTSCGDNIVQEYMYQEIKENIAVNVNSTVLLGRFFTLKQDLWFDIDAGNDDHKFTLLRTGDKLAIHRLDYESHQYRELRINVTGRSSDLHIGLIFVAIKVIDMNDNPPVFLPLSTSTFSIPVTAEPTTPFFQFVAEDKDSDENGWVRYYLTGDTSIVDVIPGTGIVVLKHKLTEDTPSFTVTVVASDGVHNVTSRHVTFHVFDPIAGYPLFDQLAYFGRVSENTPIGTSISIRATPALSVHLKEHDVTVDVLGTNKPFRANSPYGDIYTNTSLDRENKDYYALAIQSVANHISHALMTTVFALIEVTDENDESPHFPFSVNRTTVSLHDAPNTTVVVIEAVDKDAITQLVYNVNGGGQGKFHYTEADNKLSIIADNPSSLPPNVTFGLTMHVHDENANHEDSARLMITVN